MWQNGIIFTPAATDVVDSVLVLLASPYHNSNSILFYHSKKSLYYYTIQFYNIYSILNFYFPILLIKIIYLHNKIIFPPITFIYSFFLVLSVQQPQILQKTPSPPLHYTHLTPPLPPTSSNP